jgi:hypothetical protein
VRILLDEQLPRQLARAGLENGALLARAAEKGFEVLVTGDQNLEFQQDLAGSPLRVIVMVALSNALEDLLPLVPAVLAAIPSCSPGSVVRVEA